MEETTLSVSEDIHLLRRGKPFSFIDDELRTIWTIYPFAYELQPNAKTIKIDWEHTKVEFVKPVDLHKYDHVPLLEVSMRRVLVSDETDIGLQLLAKDHESGAQALAVKALEILLNSVQKGDLSKLRTTKDFWRELRGIAWHLAKNGRPSMSAAIETQIFKTLKAMRNKIEASTEQISGAVPISEARKIAKEAIELSIAAQNYTLEKLAEFFVEYIDSRLPVHGRADQEPHIRIVTLSSSGTVTKCLSKLILILTTKGVCISLSVLESRPNFEGISFVNALLSALPLNSDVIDKLIIDIASDASMATVTRNAHYLVLGGDKVLPNGDVSNKIGSLSTAIVARTTNPNCHVIATFDTSKVTASNFEDDHNKAEYNGEAEMVSAWPKGLFEELQEKRKLYFKVEVKNSYFEWVTAQWIDTYISEEGVLSVEDIERLGKQARELEDTVFSDFLQE